MDFWVDNGPFMKDALSVPRCHYRGSLAEPQICRDCNAIMKGRAPDVRFGTWRHYFRANSPFTTIKRYANLIVNTFVTTIAANEASALADKTRPSMLPFLSRDQLRQPPEPETRAPFFLERILAITVFQSSAHLILSLAPAFYPSFWGSNAWRSPLSLTHRFSEVWGSRELFFNRFGGFSLLASFSHAALSEFKKNFCYISKNFSLTT